MKDYSITLTLALLVGACGPDGADLLDSSTAQDSGPFNTDGGPGIDGRTEDSGPRPDVPGSDSGPRPDVPAVETCVGDEFGVASGEVVETSSSSATIEFYLCQPGQAYFEYGTDTTYGDRNAGEMDLLDFHRQRVRGLRPATTYHGRVVATNAAGEEARSLDLIWTTSNAPVSREGWPSDVAGYDESLPMSNIFFGQPMQGSYGSGNSNLAAEVGWSFRASRSGRINAVGWQNRVLAQSVITRRCDDGNGDERYCACIADGLNAQQCSWTRGNSYSVGTGGRLQAHIYPARADAPTLPDETRLLGRMAEIFVPVSTGTESLWIEHPLESPVQLSAGETYFVLIKNFAAPDGPVRGRRTHAEARAMDPNLGAISLNGLYLSRSPEDERKYGPYYDNTTRTMVRPTTASAWQAQDDHMGFATVIYEDGLAADGQLWRCNGSQPSRNLDSRRIDGNLRVRQRFIVRDVARRATGLWVAYGHVATGANGRPLHVEIKYEGRVLHAADLPSEPAVAQAAMDQSGSVVTVHPRVWRYIEFPSTIDLLLGETYFVELSAASGAGFVVNEYSERYPFPNGELGYRFRDFWTDAYAQQSSNGGSSWALFDTADPDGDIAMLFTLEGMPTWLDQ